jgi:anhydro-N-acetylmuramic acid kinase
MREYFIGLMSGTSLDGVDAVAASFEDDGTFAVLADHAVPMPGEVRSEVLALQSIGSDELRRSARLANRLAVLYAEAVTGVLSAAGLEPDSVRAIGCHGQTVRHAPGDGYTLQIGNLSLLAELTGIDVAGDFRSRDVAAGGQGAPLVPAFHQAAFAHPERARVIVNIGGISNLTLLLPGEPVSGFDCGPGNMLMDAWIRHHLGRDYDAAGAWAASGRVDAALLAALLDEPFFAAPPPKSTGRDLFDLGWLEQRLATRAALQPADVQATLLAQTACGIADAIERFAAGAEEVFLCGGGARNATLVSALAARMPTRRLADSSELGLPAHQVEATAFAWLARQLCRREPGNQPAATGAAGPRVLGALYPGRA